MPLLCETVNHYLLHSVQNLQPIQTMLTCPMDEIEHHLTFHHITAPVGGFSDHLGMPIAQEEEPRLAFVVDAHQLVPGCEIAWVADHASARFLYGRVSIGTCDLYARSAQSCKKWCTGPLYTILKLRANTFLIRLPCPVVFFSSEQCRSRDRNFSVRYQSVAAVSDSADPVNYG